MIRSLATLFCLAALLAPTLSQAQYREFSPGDVMPLIEMPVPKETEHVQYLGLSPDAKTFVLSDLGDKAVIVEIFSMYCPICQAEAPLVNEIFAMIGARGLHDKITMLGIGAGNSELEVQVFGQRYDVKFPLIPDADYALYNVIGGGGTPYFIGLVPNQEGGHVVRFSHLGAIDVDAKTFLDRILEAVELK